MLNMASHGDACVRGWQARTMGLLAMVCLALLLCLAHAAQADEVAVPTLSARVTDLTATLSADQQATLENKLAQLEQQRGSQVAVLIVPTTQPESIEQYSIRVTDAWKLGRAKQDDGVLILVAKNDRKMRIEVGYGLEGAIPDIYAKRIVSETMAPRFRQGDFYGGLDAAVDKVAALIAGENLPPPPQSQAKSSQHDWGDLFPVMLIGGLILGGILRTVLGSFLGGLANGGLIGAAVWILGGGLVMALVLALIAFVLTLLGIASLGNFGGFGGGYGGGGNSTFSGGGGGFGGGGASGDW